MSESPRDEFRRLMVAYAGFQMATALVVATSERNIEGGSLAVSLFAISIPSTLAYGSLMEFGTERKPNTARGLCSVLAYVPSVAALSVLLSAASLFAAGAFPAMALVWVIYLYRRLKNP